ncbi:hypothetical protein RSSM_05941 [Rhodopirellula sallentina SM41]|uniref:Uncharacterized protein n=1 Tax=Rhodopirellula sallentina SM41 TaxID=1263870 RepID=M5TTZ3_9BACT|nr:hypothetical protein RSSM_05941 [Rhodopirellula sallentina SM41]
MSIENNERLVVAVSVVAGCRRLRNWYHFRGVLHGQSSPFEL